MRCECQISLYINVGVPHGKKESMNKCFNKIKIGIQPFVDMLMRLLTKSHMNSDMVSLVLNLVLA